MVALESTVVDLQEALERALAAWLGDAGTGDRAAIEARLRYGRAAVNRLEIGFSRDALAFHLCRDSKKDEKTVEWMRRELSMSLRAANSALQVGWFADDLPLSVAATEEGRIGFGHLTQIASTAEYAAELPVTVPDGELVMPGDVRPPVWNETRLLATAERQPIGKFTTTCQDVQHALDADRVTRKQRTMAESQHLELWSNSDGTLGIHGWLDPESGMLVRRAIESLAAPCTANDSRKASLRNAEALGELAQIALDAGKVGASGGVRPHISVIAGVDTLYNLEGAMAVLAESGETLPDHTGRRLACDATVGRVLLDAKSVPIDVGRDVRVVGKALRDALVARDRGCRWPGCNVPAWRCHAHHIVHWVDGGETNVANCVLLCRRHHRELHEGEYELDGDVTTGFTVRRRDELSRHGPRPFNWMNPPDGHELAGGGDGGVPDASDGPDDGERDVATMPAWMQAAVRAEARAPDSS